MSTGCIRRSKVVLPLSESGATSDISQQRQFELVVYERRQPRRFSLPLHGSISIGRSADCDVRLEYPSISRHHAALHLNPLEVEDHGSKNGSWLFAARDGLTWDGVMEGHGEGMRLERGRRYELMPGDVLKLGRVIIGVQAAAPVVHTEPIKEEPPAPADLVLEDPEMKRVYELALRVAPTALPVLILGETGVGKDVLAERIHAASLRHKGPFVRVNCGALAESLLESELFGHQRGAFTGAADAKPGLLELGHGGTIFLDEIGELPLQTQVKLLHVLETSEVTRVGATRSRRIDVRFIAATNRDLARDVQVGSFRKDLYFRINAVSVKILPLRERRTEVEALARFFLRRFCRLTGIAEPVLTSEAIAQLQSYSWPGNVRELKNVMERAPIICGAGEVQGQHLPTEEHLTQSLAPDSSTETWPDHEETMLLRRAPRESDPSHQRIAEALQVYGGNQTRAARLLGISRRTLVNRLNEYNLPRPRKRGP
jgi:two-component system, NtrC family, response regulator AtoC